jgi:hypothetical protein
MKRLICFLSVVALCATLCAGRALAQEASHVQIGVFADYLRTSQTDTNSAGVGGRLGIPIFHRIKLEGEVAYDFDQAFTEGFTNNGTGSVSFQRTNMRVLQGLFGPKLELGHGWFHPFLELKGGFVNYQLSGGPATPSDFLSSVENLRRQNMNAALYPGGGVQGRIGPVGLRLDVGDEMYFNAGTHHNLRVAFGPFLTF